MHIPQMKNTSDDPLNRQCHDSCLKLKKQSDRQEISMSEFLKELAYTALRYGFEELKLRQYPQRIEKMCDYDALAPYEKEKLLKNPEFWRQEDIIEYLSAYQSVKNWNQCVIEWLNELSNYIPKDDIPNQQKIKNRIAEFNYKPGLQQKVEEMFSVRGAL